MPAKKNAAVRGRPGRPSKADEGLDAAMAQALARLRMQERELMGPAAGGRRAPEPTRRIPKFRDLYGGSTAFRCRRQLWPIVIGLLTAGLGEAFATAHTLLGKTTSVSVVLAVLFGMIFYPVLLWRLYSGIPKNRRRWAAWMLVYGYGWMVFFAARGLSYNAAAIFAFSFIPLTASWYELVRIRNPLGPPQEEQEVEHIPTVPEKWERYVAHNRGALTGSDLLNPETEKYADVWTIQLVRGEQHIGDVERGLPRIATGLGMPMTDILVEKHPLDSDSSRVLLKIIRESPVKKGVLFDAPMIKDGRIQLGPYADGMGYASWRLYTENSAWGGFILGSQGSGKSRLLELIAVTVRSMGNTVMVFLDGQNGASSAALKKHANWFVPEEDAGELLESLEAILKIRNKYNIVHDLDGFNPTPEFPGILIFVDECFPAGTMVGHIPIEQLKVGDMVPSWDEETGLPCQREVLQVMSKIPSGLVRLHFDDGQSLVCTPNHPVMTDRGWLPAGSVSSGASLLSFTHGTTRTPEGSEAVRAGSGDLPGMRQGLPDHRSLSPEAMEGIGTRVLHDDLQRHFLEQSARIQTVGQAATGVLGAHAHTESDGIGRDSAEDVRDIEADRSSTSDPRWEWRRTVPSAGALVSATGLAHGAHRADRSRPGRLGVSDSLQAGHRESDPESGRGNRWGIPLLAGTPRVRSAEGSVAAWCRVDRVEVLEPGSDGRYGGLCPDGAVYNIEVAGTHTYRVNDGLVVHNCHRIWRDPKIAQRWADISREGRKVGMSIIGLSQYSGLETFGGLETLRSTLLNGNAIALRTASNIAPQLIPGLEMNPADLPDLPGYGYMVPSESDPDARKAQFRARYCPPQTERDEKKLAVPSVTEWFERIAPIELDDMSAREAGEAYLERHQIAADRKAAMVADITGRASAPPRPRMRKPDELDTVWGRMPEPIEPLHFSAPKPAPVQFPEGLTDTQRLVYVCLLKGLLTCREIAKELDFSDTHVRKQLTDMQGRGLVGKNGTAYNVIEQSA